MTLLLAAAPAQGQTNVRLPERDRTIPGAQHVWTVGVENGQDWETFHGLGQGVFDGDDNLFILDRFNAQVLAFGPDGRFLRAIGRKGQGPGEFQIPIGLALTVDGSLVVYDVASGFNVFTPEGQLVRSFRPDYGARPAMGIHAHPEGGIVYLARSAIGRGEVPPANDSANLFHHPLKEGSVPRVLARVAAPPPSVVDGGSAQSPVRVIGGPVMFEATVRYAVLPSGGIAVATHNGYAVDVLDASGRVVRRISRDIDARAVTKQDRQAAVARQGEPIIVGAPGKAPPAGLARQIMQSMQFADTLPVIRTLKTDAKGRIWVAREGAEPFGPTAIDVLEPTGEYLGTLPPQAMPIAFSRNGLVAFVERDEETEVERLVVRRLPSWSK